jgi:hypothetical protein
MKGVYTMRRRLLSSLLLLLSGLLCAQTTNQQVSGTVTDSSGASVPSATVTLTSQETNLTRSTVTNADGNYVITNLPIGTYSVSATAQGFKKFVLTGIELEVGGKLAVNAILEPGQLNETVTVEASAVEVQTSSGEVGHLVTGEEATQIQLNGRNYIQLLTLAPGVSSTVISGFALFGNFGVNGNSQSVNGLRPDTFNFNINGVDNKDNGGGGNNFVNISPDMLAEFRTVAASYSAEYGGSSGATVSVALKSGTKAFHGTLYEYFRYDAIQAYAFQPVGTKTPVKPPLRYNNFGWNLGGPLWIPGVLNKSKDKLFFFVGEDYKRKRSSTLTSWSVPSVAQQSGDFSAFPSSQWPINPATGQAFAGGIIPHCSAGVTTGCASANGLALASLFPVPNAGTNFNFLSLAPLNTHEYLVKVDYNLSPRNQIMVDYVHDYYTSLGGPTDLINFQRTLPGLTSSVQWTGIINPTTVNTLIAAYSGNVIREKQGITGDALVQITNITKTGNGLNYPSLFNASPDIPSVTVAGYQALTATALNFNNFNRIFSLKDDFSKILGNHTLKVGINAWRSRKNQDVIPAINGTFGFLGNSGQSGALASNQALANMLMGNFATYQEGSSIQQGWFRFTQIESYVQDDWKVSKRLTLNLGLRYQYMQPQYSALNNASTFLPAYYNPSQAAVINPANGNIISASNPFNGLVLPGSGFPAEAIGRVPASVTNNPAITALFHNLPLGLANTDWGTWSPRVGFAYDLTGKQSTVLRGGMAVSNERIEGNYLFNSVAQPPFVSLAQVTNGNVDNPAGSTAAAPKPSTVLASHVLGLKDPRVLNWSFGIQQKLSGNMIAEVAYVGSSASQLTYDQDINQLPPGTIQANPGVNVNALRPYKGYADIFQLSNGANSHYNSLQARLQKRIQRAGTVNASFTWSKAMTDAVAYNSQPQDSYNLRGDYGPANYNRDRILVVSYVYPLPFWQNGQEWYKKALGGWQISGVTNISTGLPINILLPSGVDGAGSGVPGSVAANGAVTELQRPNLIGNPFANTGGTQYLNPIKIGTPGSAFATPVGSFGNLGAFAIKGPMMNNWDASLQKSFVVKEGMSLDFRAEFFNFPNHLSAFTVANILGAANFGQVTATTDPRTMEFALRFAF